MTSLLTALLRNPHDPMRGALSDRWTEYGVPPVVLPGGQVIEPTDPRVVYRDGDAVPWGLEVTMAGWCGEECKRCNGSRFIVGWPCSLCHGAGRIPGIAAAVCGEWPIVSVELTDRNPFVGPSTGIAAWVSGRGGDVTSEQRIYTELLSELKDARVLMSTRIRTYNTIAAARDALSHAALTLGRRAAGLPDLPVTVEMLSGISPQFTARLRREVNKQVKDFFKSLTPSRTA